MTLRTCRFFIRRVHLELNAIKRLFGRGGAHSSDLRNTADPVDTELKHVSALAKLNYKLQVVHVCENNTILVTKLLLS